MTTSEGHREWCDENEILEITSGNPDVPCVCERREGERRKRDRGVDARRAVGVMVRLDSDRRRETT